MSKKIHRYVRAVDPIRKRFGCTLMQAGDYVETLLSYERQNIDLKADVKERKEFAKLQEEAIEKANFRVKELEIALRLATSEE